MVIQNLGSPASTNSSAKQSIRNLGLTTPPPALPYRFYQARPGTCQWYWGMCWDHVVSYDLAHWERMPMALVPTPGGIDADGCFSGSIQVRVRVSYGRASGT